MTSCSITILHDRLVKETCKSAIRQGIWDFMEATNIAQFPRPVHHRIPNFKGAREACAKFCTLPEFDHATSIKVGPDKPLEHCRYMTLKRGKSLIVPTPRLRTGLFNRILPPSGDEQTLKSCATSRGVKDFSKPIPLMESVSINVVVCGSVAVSRRGDRIGKGEGFSDLELAMMQANGSLNDDVPIVTIVHDCQVVDFDEKLCGEHDFPVDIIVTPTEIIHCERRIRPKAIFWNILTPEKLAAIPILNQLRDIEERSGLKTSQSSEQAAVGENSQVRHTTGRLNSSACHQGERTSRNDSSIKSKRSKYRTPHLR